MSTREETKDSDLHIVSPMTKGRNQTDRMGVWEPGLDLTLADMTNAVLVRSRCEAFWEYPPGSLDGYVLRETRRSERDRLEAREFLLRPPSMPRGQAEALISPKRVDYKRFP